MPKNNKKRGAQKKGGGGGAGVGVMGSHPPTDEENSTGGDNWSTASVLSDGSSYEAGLGDSAVEAREEQPQEEENTEQENFEDKLCESIEGLTVKSGPQRKKHLEALKQCLSKKYCAEFLDKRKETMTDSLLKCVKRGKTEEQTLAARCLALLALQLADSLSCVYTDIINTLSVMLNDNTAPVLTRAQCASTLGICCFVNASVCDDDVMELRDRLGMLEGVFSGSQRKVNDTIQPADPAMSPVNVSCVDAWCLLMTRAPSFYLQSKAKSHISLLGDLLLSSDTDLKIAAGEAIALLYDLNRCIDEEFDDSIGETSELCEQLKGLSVEYTKHRARTAMKQQRSKFRDILHTVQDGDVGELTVNIGRWETLSLDDWTSRVQYTAICNTLNSGMSAHLQENVMLRELFNLGAPLVAGFKPQQQMSKVQRKLYNCQAEKVRSLQRSKNRDKRSVPTF